MQATQNFHALLQSHATATHDAVAVVHGSREIGYAQFAADLDKVTCRFNACKIAPGSRAVLFMANPYLHWLAVIALWRLGVISVTVYKLDEPGLLQLLKANVLVSDRAGLQVDGGGAIAISDAWLSSDAANLPPIAEQQLGANHPVRILLSSGTTGTPKKILLTDEILNARITQTKADYSHGPHTRFMAVVGLDTTGGFVYPLSIWAAGGAVVFYDARTPLHQQLTQSRPNFLFMSPAQAANAVDALPADFTPSDAITLLVGGGRMPQAAAEKALSRLAVRLWLVYGSTEAGTVSLSLSPDHTRPEMVGSLVSTAELQIIDPDGQALPPGAVGEVRMRGIRCVTSYLDEPEFSRAYFKDGWFHPGDLGTLSETGDLAIVGRAGDIMNLGGQKVAPNVFEDALSACRGVKELAAFSVPDALGAESLWIAITVTEGFVQDDLLREFRERFPKHRAPNVVRVNEMPRNAMAKVQRNVLRDIVAKALTVEVAQGAA